MVATEVATMTQGSRTDLAQIRAKSQADAAKLLNVGRTSVQTAKKIKEQAPDLAEEVTAGRLSLNAAAKKLKDREEPTAPDR